MTPRRLTLPTAGLLAAVFAAGCSANHDHATVEVRPADAKTMSLEKLQASTAATAAVAGAKAGQAELAAAERSKDGRGPFIVITAQTPAVKSPTPPTPPTPAPPPIPATPPDIFGPPVIREIAAKGAAERTQPAISLNVRSDKPHTTREEGIQDALRVAQAEIQSTLAKLNPPVLTKPHLSTIRSEFIRKDGIHEEQLSAADKLALDNSKAGSNRMYVRLDIEVSEDQVRQLRAGERVSTGFQYGAVLFAALLAIYGFLRLDAWTKGYLTSWLAIGAVALVAVALLAVLA
jgi:hypothetical protein